MAAWNDDLLRWLEPFLAKLGHKARRRMCPLYVARLIGPGDRKSVGPMAERMAPRGYDQLHHFVSDGVWDEAPLELELANQADKLVGGADAVVVVDDTTLPKKGTHSVGVAPQYASALGKTANCQTLVSLTLARRRGPGDGGAAPVLAGELDRRPSSTANAPARPPNIVAPRTKSAIALAEIGSSDRRRRSLRMRFSPTPAMAWSAEFRQALSARGLAWAVGILRHQKVHEADSCPLPWPKNASAGDAHARTMGPERVAAVAAPPSPRPRAPLPPASAAGAPKTALGAG